jgi:hypothetical protein
MLTGNLKGSIKKREITATQTKMIETGINLVKKNFFLSIL